MEGKVGGNEERRFGGKVSEDGGQECARERKGDKEKEKDENSVRMEEEK